VRKFSEAFGAPEERPTERQNATNREGFCSDLWLKYSQLKASDRDRVEKERESERERE